MMFEIEMFVEVDYKQFEASFLTIFGDSFNGRDQGWVFWEANFIGVVDDITCNDTTPLDPGVIFCEETTPLYPGVIFCNETRPWILG